MWKGRIIGAIIGIFFGGVGAILGFFIGYLFVDKPAIERLEQRNRARDAFKGQGISPQEYAIMVDCIFSFMGYISRGAGAINQSHINFATGIMGMMNLDEQRRKKAIEAFQRGKSADFDFHSEIYRLKGLIGNNATLLSYVMESFVTLALADEVLSAGERERLMEISRALGIADHLVDAFIRMRFAEIQLAHATQRFKEKQQQQQQSNYQSSSGYRYQSNEQDDNDERSYQQQIHDKDSLDSAYAVLGVTKASSWEEIRKAHKRLMLKYHPDRLASQGIPPEMVPLYEQKAKDIQQAFTLIKTSLGK